MCVCVSVCSPGMPSKSLVRTRHLLTILRSWFNKLLPQGGLVLLFHSALQIKVDETSFFFSVLLKESVELVTFLY